MDNTTVTETKLNQVPESWSGSPAPQKKGSWRGALITILALAVVAFLAYWYFAAPENPPFSEQATEETQVVGRTRDVEMAAIIEAENELNDLYFEGVSGGL